MHNSSGASGQRASSPMGAKKLRDAHADVFTDVDLEESDSHTGPGQEVADPDESGSAYSPSSRKHPGLASPVVFSRDNSSAGRASPSSTTSMVRYDPGQRPAASTSRPPAYQMSADQRRARIQNFHSVMNAAREGNADALQALPLADIDLDAPDADGLTALHHAAANGHIRVSAAGRAWRVDTGGHAFRFHAIVAGLKPGPPRRCRMPHPLSAQRRPAGSGTAVKRPAFGKKGNCGAGRIRIRSGPGPRHF